MSVLRLELQFIYAISIYIFAIKGFPLTVILKQFLYNTVKVNVAEDISYCTVFFNLNSVINCKDCTMPRLYAFVK